MYVENSLSISHSHYAVCVRGVRGVPHLFSKKSTSQKSQSNSSLVSRRAIKCCSQSSLTNTGTTFDYMV